MMSIDVMVASVKLREQPQPHHSEPDIRIIFGLGLLESLRSLTV